MPSSMMVAVAVLLIGCGSIESDPAQVAMTLRNVDPTLPSPHGMSVTLPNPPNPNKVDPAQIPEFYEESLNAVLVGRQLDEAIVELKRTGWIVRTDHFDGSDETFTADLRIGRATVRHRNGVDASITVG